MAITEKITLLSAGTGMYKDIPDVLTLKSLPTMAELDYVGSEDFDEAMLTKIMPQAVEEKIDFGQLLEIDYQWLCRCIRIMNFGPYFTTNSIFCDSCGQVSRGEYRVNLNSVGCKPLPDKFTNRLTIKKTEFLDFKKDIELHLLTIREARQALTDQAFAIPGGQINKTLARICYMIKSIGTDTNLTPVDVKFIIEKDLSQADYTILKSAVSSLSDYGLRAGGETVCPKCNSGSAAFMALVDDRFFFPTVGDLREWRNDRPAGGNKNIQPNSSTAV